MRQSCTDVEDLHFLLLQHGQIRKRQHTIILCILLAFCTCSHIPTVASLACYVTENGRTTIAVDNSWTLCALVPPIGNSFSNGSQHGLGPENDGTAAYNNVFAIPMEEYRVLTVCIYERYDFSWFLKAALKPEQAVDFTFRCVCNYDLCNSEATFSVYLSALKSDSFSGKKR